jgi:amino acid transporter
MKKNNNSKTRYYSFIKITLFFILIFSFAITPSNINLEAANLWDKQVGLGDPEHRIAEAFDQGDTPEDIRQVIARIISVFLGFLAIIFLVLIIWAGYKWMTAAGNEDQIRESKKQITTAIIGLTIILLSYSITLFVTNCIYEVSTEYLWMCRIF